MPLQCGWVWGAGPEGLMEAVEGPGRRQMGHLHGRIQSGSSDMQMETAVDSPLTAAVGSGCLSCTNACGILLLTFSGCMRITTMNVHYLTGLKYSNALRSY